MIQQPCMLRACAGNNFPRASFSPSFVSETLSGLPVSDSAWNMSPDNLKRSTYKGLRAIYSKACVPENIAVFMCWVHALLMNCSRKTVASLFSDSSQHSQGKIERAKEGSRHKDKTQTNWKFTNHLYSETGEGVVVVYKIDSSLSAFQTAGNGHAKWISMITPIFFSTGFVQAPENKHNLS